MRTLEDIERAIAHLKDAFHAARYANDDVQQKALSVAIMALKWVVGSNEPGGFGEMLRMMEMCDEMERRSEKALRN